MIQFENSLKFHYDILYYVLSRLVILFECTALTHFKVVVT